MIIHIISSGESIFKLAMKYDTTQEAIIEANELLYPDKLSIGMSLVIPTKQSRTVGTICVGGYVYPFINDEILQKTLPNLSYIVNFSHTITSNGDIIPNDDAHLYSIISNQNVLSIVSITNLTTQGTFDSEAIHILLNSKTSRDNFINNSLILIKDRGFRGIDLDFEYIPAVDKTLYSEFVKNITTVLNRAGGEVFVALPAKSSDTQSGLLVEAYDYKAIGEAANAVFLMTYEWGYAYSPPRAVAPMKEVRAVVEYAKNNIDSQKIILGIPAYGYDWTLPFERNLPAKSISCSDALNLASKTNAQVKYDQNSMSPYFGYKDTNGRVHTVHFEDARSISAKISLVNEFSLRGIGYWNLMKYFSQNWQVLNSYYEIEKF